MAGDAFVGECRMAGREILAGFFIAGAVAALVPPTFFESVFPQGLPGPIGAVVHAVIAVLADVVTVIGSLGNGPLPAVLWDNGVAFAGVLAFLASDFVVPPSLKINANYDGWRFALYLGAIFTVAAVVTGVAVHGVFSLVGLVPPQQAPAIDQAPFKVDYPLVLNVLAATAAVALAVVRRSGERRPATGAPA